jgi:hypothetical protein
MDQHKRITWIIVCGVLAVGLLLSALLPGPAGAAEWLRRALEQPARPAVVDTANLSGDFIGQVQLDYSVPGIYSDLLPTPGLDCEPLPELGVIDLGLELSQQGAGIEGYVDLEHTMVFTTEHTIASTAFGPQVSGEIDGNDLTLESERISLLSGGQRLMRQFRMTGTLVSGSTRQISGEYRETVWGYGPQPMTVVGRFKLLSPAAIGDNFLFLPQIMR